MKFIKSENFTKRKKYRAIENLIIVLLILMIIFLLSQVNSIFNPIKQFLGIAGLPIVISGLFYYILNPIVDFMEKKGVRRNIGITILFIFFIGLTALGIIVILPKIEIQFKNFIENWPNYWRIVETKINEFLKSPSFENSNYQIESSLRESLNSITGMIKDITKNTFSGIGDIVGKFTNLLITLVTVPFILFYLLKDGKKIGNFIKNIIPNKFKKKTMTILKDVNNQLSTYVRGQITVALIVSIMFIIGFSIIGLKYSMTLGILAGILNLIPYVGSALATIPALLIALVEGPKMLMAVIIIFILEQFIEGRFISPLILGSQLDIHPITIIFVLLSAGKIFGVMGVIIGIPVYVTIKVIVIHYFTWYKESSGLY